MRRDPQKITVGELLPQRPPFIMIDRLCACDEKSASAQLQVRPDNLFVEEGLFPATGMLECIAQTCAARIGFLTLQGGGNVKIGVIGSISNLNIIRTPRVGESMNISIIIKEEVFNITLVEAAITVNGEEICNGVMKIALTDKETKE